MAAKTEPNISTSNQIGAVTTSGWRLPSAMNGIASTRAHLGGVVRRGAAVVVNSIGAVAPALAGRLRGALEAVLSDGLERGSDVASVAGPGKRAGTPSAERGPLLSRAIMPLFDPAVTTQSEVDPEDPHTKNKCPPVRNT